MCNILFFDKFSKLNLDAKIKMFFEDAVITRMTYNSSKTVFKIYVTFSKIAGRKVIDTVQKELTAQIAPFYDAKVYIYDSYELSSLHNFKSVFEEYSESFKYSFEKKNIVMSVIFGNADFEIEDEKITMTVDDSFVTKQYAEEIREVIKQVMLEKFGYDIEIELKYEKNRKSRVDYENEYRINKMIEEISERTTAIPNDAKVKPEPKKQTKTETKTETKTFEKRVYSAKRSDNPDVCYGREFDGDSVSLALVSSEMEEIIVRGQVFGTDVRKLKNGNYILLFNITDFEDSISVKIFLKEEQYEEIKDDIKDGNFYRIKGTTEYDKFSGEMVLGSIYGIMKSTDFRVKRMDNSLTKRVELHCHTKMSEMDGVSDVSDILKQAAGWGMKSLAITDHGVVQAFTEAFHTKLPDDFKIIYGVEAYLVDDLISIIDNPKGQSINDTCVAFDIETTGFSPTEDRIIEISGVKYKEGRQVEQFSEFVNPQMPIPFRIERLTGISDSMVEKADTIKPVLTRFLDFCGDSILVAHNAQFDMSFIRENSKTLLDRNIDNTVVDTVALSRALLVSLGKFSLDNVAKHLKIKLENHHRAIDDAVCCGKIMLALFKRLEARGITNLDDINDVAEFAVNSVQKSKSFHAIILAQNETGRVNLYRLISMSHLKYYHKRPRIPKSELIKYREGLILGSACEAGELYQAILKNSSREEISRLADFYDYYEIQPNGNNAFMIRDEQYENIKSEEDLNNINRRIVELGEQFNKPVVATCDVHFLNPEDEIYRRIIMAGQGFPDADSQAPLYLRTTEEMLDEFKYLGEEKAFEIVVLNTNKIADMCEKIEPVRPDKCAPQIDNSDKILEEICYNKAHEMYGPNLPEIVENRLKKELGSIISNGYSVMYIIAQKLVWKSNEDGYLVGSRGSVGSSFVATMAGITEVNPLSPHYLCPKCFYTDFDSEEVRAFSGNAGCDMPDKNCPHCNIKMKKEGFDIPFETFLGFDGDKEPDIDLNFSNEYQSKAHAYTEVIFGDGQTFKAGTVGTLADKTVYGYVKKYYEERGVHKRDCEINRLVSGAVGIKRSTGQHPGGIIVLPYGEEIHSFTPVQHPANDMESSIVTTHFDYHSIDHNLLKLDILGHLDPTMIRMLQDLTGQDPREIPLDSKEVMSLFKDTSALGISPEDIGGTKLGCLGIPEFGTDFAMQMLIDTKPQYFSDLVRIAGLSHGTDVWLGNAQKLISEGTATISTAICTRDDIMVYLIHMGLPAGTAFKIMENVRKGKVAKGKCDKWAEWKEEMIKHGVPDWYIWSCERIQYMFPKAHAAAYVMMAWRIAYCKIFYPLAYYASFFSIRATDFSYEIMCFGKEKLDSYIETYKNKEFLSDKEKGQLGDMRIVQEMYARGFEFLPIDLFKSHSRNFQIVDGKLLPPFKAIDGLGENAADGIMEAAKNGEFLSVEDFISKSKVTKTNATLLKDLGILKNLPESNQLSLFDGLL